MKLLVIFWTLILFSCGSAVVVDYDSKTDFSNYRTFNFFPSIDSGLNDLEHERIVLALDSILPLKGLQREEEPQLYVNFYVSERITPSRSTLGIGFGTGGGNVGVGISGGIPVGGNEIEQQLTVDLIDVRNDQLIWQGILNGRFKEMSSPDQKKAYYENSIAKLLKQFPPLSKKNK